MKNTLIPGTAKNRLDLDPVLDKDTIKEKITQRIMEQVDGVSREDVYLEVSRDYDRLLQGATVTTHIPVLVEGEVRAEERRKVSTRI
jgi:hypothetical protein